MVLPLATLVASHSAADVLVLIAAVLIVAIAGLPLARHLWNTPTNAPEYLPHRIRFGGPGGRRHRPVLHSLGRPLERQGGEAQ